MLKQLLMVLLAGAALVACEKKEEAADKPTESAEKTAEKGEKAAEKPAAKPAGHPIWGSYDLAAELKKLEGKWSVRSSISKDRDTWEIKGDKVTITKADGSTQLAKLIMGKPGEIAVKQDGTTSYYGYARNGDDVYIGLGRSGIKVGDTYYVRADRGLVVYDGKACKYHKEKMSFGKEQKEFEAPKDVKCELQTGGDKAVLHYQTPKFMKEGEFEDNQIPVVGEALINEQLMGHKVEAPTAAAPPPATP